MHRLRRARNLATMVLAWFVLSLGVAMLAPAMAGVPLLEDICSVDPELVVHGSDTSGSAPEHREHCAACVHSSAPPYTATVAAVHLHAPAAAPVPMAQPVLPSPPPAPWTARGPPSFS